MYIVHPSSGDWEGSYAGRALTPKPLLFTGRPVMVVCDVLRLLQDNCYIRPG